LTPKELKILGAAEPRYVLQSPGLVENCVGLCVPLLEFNRSSEVTYTTSAGLLVKVNGICRSVSNVPT
jgi:hypothetical protein